MNLIPERRSEGNVNRGCNCLKLKYLAEASCCGNPYLGIAWHAEWNCHADSRKKI